VSGQQQRVPLPGAIPGAGPREPEGGDPVCWLSQVCDDCGAINEPDADNCWRCGAARGEANDAAKEPQA